MEILSDWDDNDTDEYECQDDHSNKCDQCGRPTKGGLYGVCDACRLGPI